MRTSLRGALAAGVAALLLTPIGASAATDAPEGPIIDDPGFESGEWGERTEHNHASIVSPGADGSGHAAQIGLSYTDDETQVPIGSTLPVRGVADRGMVNKTVRGIEPNTVYEFSVKLKGTDIRWGIFDTEASLYYRGLAVGDGGGEYDAGITTPGEGTEWETYTSTITTGPRTDELDAFCFIGGQGPAWCDDFAVTKVGPAEDPQAAPDTWQTPPLGENGFPVTIPAVQEFTAEDAAWTGDLERVVVDEADREAIGDEAHLGSANLAEALGSEIQLDYGTAAETPAGQVFVQLGDVPLPEEVATGADSLHAEAYRIDISPERITVTAGGEAGVLYALSTLTQALRSTGGHDLPAGTVTDWTDMEVRALQVDSGRRYYSIDWLKDQVKDLAYTHMNTMVLRVKDGQGLRVESEVFPELVDDMPDGGHWTKAEIADLVAFADRFHVTIIPEFDMPAHASLDAKVFTEPGYTLGGEAYNYARADVRDRLEQVAVEMGETFDSPYVHVGADEFMSMEDHQAPIDWVRDLTGDESATARDAYVAFLNGVNDALTGSGRHMVMWNDMLNGENRVVELDKDVTIIFWAEIYGSLNAEELIDQGYHVIGSSSDLYHDLWPTMGTGDQTSGDSSNGSVINRPLPEYAWTHYANPFVFSGGWGPPAEVRADQHGMVRGQFFPIWDDSHGWAPESVLTQTLLPRLRLFAQTVWNSPRPTDSFADFDPYLRFLGHAPFFEAAQVWEVPEVAEPSPDPTDSPEPTEGPADPGGQDPDASAASDSSGGTQDPDATDDGRLPDTGADVAAVVLTAAVLLAIGGMIVAVRRRRLEG